MEGKAKSSNCLFLVSHKVSENVIVCKCKNVKRKKKTRKIIHEGAETQTVSVAFIRQVNM